MGKLIFTAILFASVGASAADNALDIKINGTGLYLDRIPLEAVLSVIERAVVRQEVVKFTYVAQGDLGGGEFCVETRSSVDESVIKRLEARMKVVNADFETNYAISRQASCP